MSASMNFANKFLMHTWNFKFPNVIMFSQLFLTVLILFLLSESGSCLSWLVKYNLSTAKKILPITCVFCFNTIIALKALDGMNIPMYNAVKRCGPIVCLLLSQNGLTRKYFIPQETSLLIYAGIALITIGTFLAASGDLDFDLTSYTYGILSVFAASLYHLLVQTLGATENIDALSIG